MYKLLIADDFFVERENVKDIIQEAGLELEICGEVSNGYEALDVMKREQPDFLLADIEMPGMNGLELAKVTREVYPEIKVIFFSFYSKFEYARKAIDLDAYAYILKPIVKEEMVAALQKIIDGRKDEIRHREQDQELQQLLIQSKPLLIDKFKRDLFSGVVKDNAVIWEKAKYLELRLNKGCYVVLAVEMDDYESRMEACSLEKRELASLRLTAEIERTLEQGTGYISVRMDDAHWGILLNLTEDRAGDMQDDAYNTAACLIERLQSAGMGVSVGISMEFGNIGNTAEMYGRAMYAISFKYNLGKGQIIRSEDVGTESVDLDIHLADMEKVLRGIIFSGKEDQVSRFIDDTFGGVRMNTSQKTAKSLCFSIIICTQLILNELNMSFEAVFGKEKLIWEKLLKFETIQDVKMWLKNILTGLIQHIDGRNHSQAARIVESVREYVDRNFSKAISVGTIADNMFYNANYLNNLFKQETGETILNYITRIRVEKAKALLAASGMKLYEVCEAVGYSNESYFKSVFRDYTGLTPKEFRDRFQLKQWGEDR